MKKTSPVILLVMFLVFGAVLVQAKLVDATIYTYTDKEGIVHFTNVPTSALFKPIPSTVPRRSVRRYEYQYQPFIDDAANVYDVDPDIIKAIIKAESNFDRYAISHKGAKGLMQLMPGTASDMKVKDCYDPRENIFGGTKYFKKMYKIFDGDLKLALASYNAGPDRVRRSRTVPDITETKQYIKRVLKNYKQYQKH